MGKPQFKTCLDQRKAECRRSNIAVQGEKNINNAVPTCAGISHLIHILAKQETPIKARRRVLGRVPAKLNTRVTMTRSMLVLLRADDMVKPPIRSMIVGENIVEKTNLVTVN